MSKAHMNATALRANDAGVHEAFQSCVGRDGIRRLCDMLQSSTNTAAAGTSAAADLIQLQADTLLVSL